MGSLRKQSIAVTIQEIIISKSQTFKKGLTMNGLAELEGKSLFCLDSNNCFRLLATTIVKSQPFESFTMLLILASSIFLALDNPLNPPDSPLATFLKTADIFLTSFFVLECLLKIIMLGLIFNKENSYLRNGWNVIDFVVVIISLISLLLTGSKFKEVKILRLLRVLRPLRVISRNKGLKIGIQALFMALPSIGNVIIVSALFFLVFGIIGVNYFKGTSFSC